MPSPCCAFRASDLQPCANTKRPGSDVCHAHRNFYEKASWLKRFASLDSPLLLTGLVFGENTMLARIEHVVEYSLNAGKIVLTKEDVAALECPDFGDWVRNHPVTLVDLYTVMVRTGKVNPRWNVNLLKLCFATYAKMYAWETRDILPSLETRIGPFLRYPGEKPHELVMMLLVLQRAFLNSRHFRAPERQHVPDLMSRQLAHECFGVEPVKRTALYSTEEWMNIFDKKAAAATNLNVDPVKVILTEIVPQYRNDAKMLLRGRMDPLKRDLMEAAWHPRRVEAWLNAGDFELLEMMMG
jgi:hypothetical protein